MRIINIHQLSTKILKIIGKRQALHTLPETLMQWFNKAGET